MGVRQRTLGRGWSWSTSGREHWTWIVVVEARQGTLGVDGRDCGPADNTGRGLIVVEVRQGTLGEDGRA